MSQGLLDIRQGHVAKDVSGRCIREEKPSIGSGFNPQRSDNSKSVIQEEQSVERESRHEEPSVQDSSWSMRTVKRTKWQIF